MYIKMTARILARVNNDFPIDLTILQSDGSPYNCTSCASTLNLFYQGYRILSQSLTLTSAANGTFADIVPKADLNRTGGLYTYEIVFTTSADQTITLFAGDWYLAKRGEDVGVTFGNGVQLSSTIKNGVLMNAYLTLYTDAVINIDGGNANSIFTATLDGGTA